MTLGWRPRISKKHQKPCAKWGLAPGMGIRDPGMAVPGSWDEILDPGMAIPGSWDEILDAGMAIPGSWDEIPDPGMASQDLQKASKTLRKVGVGAWDGSWDEI